MKKKKIVWLAHEANISGANLCLKEFMQMADEAGFDQLLILPHTGNMEIVAKECNVPVKIVHYYSWTRKQNDRFFDSFFLRRSVRNAIAVFQLIFIFIKTRAGIVFTNTSVINIGAWASLFSRKKHFWYIHEMGEEDFGVKLPWGTLSYWFMNFTSEKILTNSFHLAEKYKQKRKNFHIDVARYAVFVEADITPVKWEKNTIVKLLLLGQVAETKGHLVAIEALAYLIKNNYHVQLSIVGKCENIDFRKKLLLRIDELGIKEYVVFVDFSDKPIQTIAEHHILLMCSKCEAFGRVTVEAMKTGIPVIGSDTCGTKEIIEHEKSGFLFEQGNATGLYNAIRTVIENDQLRTGIIKEAKRSSMQLTDKKQFLSFLK